MFSLAVKQLFGNPCFGPWVSVETNIKIPFVVLVLLSRSDSNKMVNATKGLLISCDIPMAQFIINLNASLPASQKFIIHILDNTHMFVQSHASDMIRSAISDFREQNSYEKPS
ncbi:GENERAL TRANSCRIPTION FACTOR IIH SUBUNIT 5 [Salix purpurea]|uniref:General transcription and DNA repair factor IIH subunit TFB5 n=1 Tax=Salix purpurea TaxID=77065 RepID=A0A9Q0YW56_SALPP|nr:GENERAL TRANSCRIPTION FACTOR IIH SUBUNIT 5 [Salix purpurea]